MIKKGQNKKRSSILWCFMEKLAIAKAQFRWVQQKISFILLAQTYAAFAHKKMQANEIV